MKAARFCLLLALGLFLAVGQSRAQQYEGVNLSGAEFAPNKLPGRYGWDYAYPTAQEFAYFSSKGMNIFRIPIRWERLQPKLGGPLDSTELGRIKAAAKMAEGDGGTVIIDIHNDAAYGHVVIGTSPVTAGDFVDLWTKIAEQFRGDDHVWFGLMNEPKIKDAAAWAQIAQQAIGAIRATGAKNTILVSGVGWDGAHNFVRLNGVALSALHDPANSMLFEVHEYFDQNYSGTHAQCVSSAKAIAGLQTFTGWLRTDHKQGFLGEFGVSQAPECLSVLDNVVAYMHDNADVWKGWTYWAAGNRWGKYMFSIEPAGGVDKPQMAALQPHIDTAR